MLFPHITLPCTLTFQVLLTVCDTSKYPEIFTEQQINMYGKISVINQHSGLI